MSQTSQTSQTSHTIEIIINTRPYEVPKDEMTFEGLAELAYPGGGGENVSFTITYRNGHGNKPDGRLAPGESVRVKDGMIFNVTRTDKS